MARGDQRGVRLPSTFRYLHAPVRALGTVNAIGRDDVVKGFADRLMFSNGGALLVSGFRGVGKTTFVQAALNDIEVRQPHYQKILGPFSLVDVWINLARPVTAGQLMHLLIRQLYLRLEAMALLPRLDARLRDDLHAAYMRTCFEISARSIATEEQGRDMSVGLGKAPLLGLEFLGKIGSTNKQSRSDEDILKYLPYDEKAAESDLLNFSERLAPSPAASRADPGRRPWWAWWRKTVNAPCPQLKVVFVLDELDKLERFTVADQDGGSPLDPLFEALKTVFTGTAFSYIFIAGKDTHERWTRDVSLGDSIYESIFAHDVYLPCLWGDQRRVISQSLFGRHDLCTADPAIEDENLAVFQRYLCFHGRGIPRRLLRELNRHVRWQDGTPTLAISPEQKRLMTVFARLQDLLEDVSDVLDASLTDASAPADDRQRLAVYYLVDEVLRRQKRTFRLPDLVAMAQQLNLGGGQERIQREVVERILKLLVGRGIVDRVVRTVVLSGREATDTADEYRLAEWVRLALESAAETPETPLGAPAPTAGPLLIGPYRVVGTIGQGGFATVYRVTSPSGQTLAAKVLHAHHATTGETLQLFGREIDVLRRLQHPSIVKIHDSGTTGSMPYFVMDFVEGFSLGSLLTRAKRLSPSAAAYVAKALAEVYGYVHGQEVVRNDIKPSNVMIDRNGGLVVIDFGIAHLVGTPELTQTVIGTPGYMAPEQVRGSGSGPRSDIFALGVLCYEMVTGIQPFRGASVNEEISNVVEKTPPPPATLAPIAADFEAVIVKAMAKDPDERFESMQAFAEALSPFAREINLAAIARDVEASANTAARDSTMMAPPGQTSPLPPSEAPVAPPVRPTPKPGPVSESPGSWPSGPPTSSATVIMSRPAPFSPSEPEVLQLLFDLGHQLLKTSWDPDHVVRLASAPVVLGRALECDIVLQHASVSRRHAMFAIDDGAILVSDLGSQSGVLVDGRREREARLTHGGEIKLGDLKVRVLFGAI